MRTKIANLCWSVVKRWKIAAPVLAILILLGGLSYAKLLPREGFPSVQFPLTIVTVTSFGNSAETIDKTILVPLNNALADNSEVDSTQTTARNDFASAVVFFQQSVKPEEGTNQLKAIVDGITLPAGTEVEYTTVNPAQYLNQYDALISVYAKDGQPLPAAEAEAQAVADQLQALPEVETASVEELTAGVTSPVTGQTANRQIYFNQIGVHEGDALQFYPSVTVGVVKTSETDVIDLSNAVEVSLAEQSEEAGAKGYGLTIGADFAETLRSDISNLQRNLLTGIAAVVVITILLISLRASFITAIFMLSVVLVTMLVFTLIGYSLNVITLFALVLTLGLFVDDATIMVEALDAEREKQKTRKAIVLAAAKKVALASFAGTLTTILVFAPLAFVGGILGRFIRVMPITIIMALLISYLLSLLLVPILARFTLIRDLAKKRASFNLTGVERYLSRQLATSIGWLKTHPWRGRVWGTAMVVLSIAVIVTGAALTSKLTFNIFPPSKDTDQLQATIDFAPGTTIAEAEALATDLNDVLEQEIPEHVEKVVYGGFTQPNERTADFVVQLSPIDERDDSHKASDLISQIQPRLEEVAAGRAEVRVVQLDVGPPASEFPFQMQVYNEDKATALDLANQISSFLQGREITKPNGQTAQVVDTKLDYVDSVTRIDRRRAVQVSAAFNEDDVSALVVGAQEAVEGEFTAEYLEDLGYSADTLAFDFGEESDNAESFSSLGIVFPIALLLMFIVLAIQFRSLLQPILIFLAIPFSFMGVVVALLVTDNALSFFSMIGAIGLVGIAVNNTIMLTDYANQAEKKHKHLAEALAVASQERFRPLVVTTLTTVVALLPLAVFDPFWQPLAVVIIGGLISSTLLVILAFPYYYYAVTKLSHWLRKSFSRLFRSLRRA